MNQTPKVGIEVGASVDRSVGRAFKQAERHVEGLSQDEKKLGRSVGQATQTLRQQDQALDSAGDEAARYSREVGEATQSNSILSRSMNQVGKGLDGVLNQWTALAGGVAGVGSAAMTLTMDERITRLGIQANRSKEDMAALKDEIFATSQLEGIRVDPGEVTAAIEKIVEKTGDLDLARRNMRNIAMTIQATGAAGSDTGAMVADMADKFSIEGDVGLLKALDTLVLQGKQGAFTLQALAAEGAAATAAYAAMGRTGPEAVREMGALLQIGMMGSGSAAEAASAFDSLLADITEKRDDFADLGIELFDPEQLAEGKKVFRSIPDIMREVMAATGGDITEYSELFGDESMRLVKVLGNEFQNTGMTQTLDELLKVQGDGAAVMKDSATAADSAAASFRNLMHVWQDIADGAFSGPLQGMADTLNSMDRETLKTLLQVTAGGAVALGGLAVGKKAWDIGSGVVDLFRGGSSDQPAGANGLKDALSGAEGVAPVYVTNMPKDGMGGADSRRRGRKRGRKRPADRSVGRAAGMMDQGKSLFRSVGRKALPLSLLFGAADITTTLMDDELSGAEKTQQVSRDVGGMGGAAAGAIAGAAIGSVVPVLGTAIGGLLGSVIGSFGGDALGGLVGGWLSDDDDKPTEPAINPADRSVGQPLQVAAPTVNVSAPEQPLQEMPQPVAPVVNVADRSVGQPVQVTAPAVNIRTPEQQLQEMQQPATPVVNVADRSVGQPVQGSAPAVNISAPEQPLQEIPQSAAPVVNVADRSVGQPVQVTAPVVNISAPEQPLQEMPQSAAPVVNIADRNVGQSAPEVQVSAPYQQAVSAADVKPTQTITNNNTFNAQFHIQGKDPKGIADQVREQVEQLLEQMLGDKDLAYGDS